MPSVFIVRRLITLVSRIRIGFSGWQYAGWRGVFYPPELTHARELEFASRAVQSIEINGSHYSLQSPASYQRWRSATPPDFVSSEVFIRLLRRYGAALVVSDAVADWPYIEDVTAGFVYLRLHGPKTLYGGSYSDEALDWWPARASAWAAGGEPPDAKRIYMCGPSRRNSRNIYCYLDNDQKVRAPFDAQRLMERLVSCGHLPCTSRGSTTEAS